MFFAHKLFYFFFRNAAERSTCTTHKLHSSIWGPIWKRSTARLTYWGSGWVAVPLRQ